MPGWRFRGRSFGPRSEEIEPSRKTKIVRRYIGRRSACQTDVLLELGVSGGEVQLPDRIPGLHIDHVAENMCAGSRRHRVTHASRERARELKLAQGRPAPSHRPPLRIVEDQTIWRDYRS